MEEFNIYLVSNASMGIFPGNTYSSFTNLLSEPISLNGEWRVALSEISTPAVVRNVADTHVVWKKGRWLALTVDSYTWHEEGKCIVQPGIYRSLEELFSEIEKSGIDLDWEINPITHKLSITMTKGEGLEFSSMEIPNILGFKATRDGKYYIGFEGADGNAVIDEKVTLEGDYPVDLKAGRHLMFVYINIIEYDSVGDTKAPLLRLIPTGKRIKNFSITETETDDSRTFKDLQFKNLISSHIQSLTVDLRDDTGDLVPFIGSGRTALTLKFQKLS